MLNRTFGCVRVAWNRTLAARRQRYATEGSPGDACGADVRHPGSSRVQSALKQEPRPARAGIPVLQGGE
jgi:hypothetical protein